MKRSAVALVLAACLSLSLAAGAQEKKPAEKAPEMSEERKAAMMAYEAAATPGPNHAFLAKMAGRWKTTVKMWMVPGEPEVTEGVSENKMILGGRFLLQEFEGTAMGKPFKGMGLTGFDNVAMTFTSVWVDNMGTGMMTGTGQLDAAGKVLSSVDVFNDPTAGGPKESRSTLALKDDGSVVMEMYDRMPDGKEVKVLEITYTRAK
jgi:hypothetical protein